MLSDNQVLPKRLMPINQEHKEVSFVRPKMKPVSRWQLNVLLTSPEPNRVFMTRIQEMYQGVPPRPNTLYQNNTSPAAEPWTVEKFSWDLDPEADMIIADIHSTDNDLYLVHLSVEYTTK